MTAVRALVLLFLSMPVLVTAAVHDRDVADPVRQSVEDAFRRADRPPPARDAGLDAAARVALGATPDVDVRALLRRAGVHDGLVLPMAVMQPDHDAVDRRWTAYLVDSVASQGVTHYGLARGGQELALLFVRRLFTPTGPIPEGTPGRTVRIAGELASGFAGIKALVAHPDGPVFRLPVGMFGRHITVDVPLDGGSGTYVVELLASGPRGPEVAAILDVVAGDAAPSDPSDPAIAPARAPTTPRGLMARVNQERRRLDLDPLRWDDSLARTARAHAKAMAKAGLAAHTLPGGKNPARRLAAAGILTTRFHENVAMAPDLGRAHEELWGSPSHRRALLDPKVNRIGVGAQAADTAAGRVIFVAQHLARR